MGGMIVTGIKPYYSENNLSQCNFLHHKSTTDWPGIELWPWRWEVETTNKTATRR